MSDEHENVVYRKTTKFHAHEDKWIHSILHHTCIPVVKIRIFYNSSELSIVSHKTLNN